MASGQLSKIGHRFKTGSRTATQTRARSVWGSGDAASASDGAVLAMAALESPLAFCSASTKALTRRRRCKGTRCCCMYFSRRSARAASSVDAASEFAMAAATLPMIIAFTLMPAAIHRNT